MEITAMSRESKTERERNDRRYAPKEMTIDVNETSIAGARSARAASTARKINAKKTNPRKPDRISDGLTSICIRIKTARSMYTYHCQDLKFSGRNSAFSISVTV